MSTHLEPRPENSKRKFPRLFLASRSESALPLADVFLIWADRTQSVVLDLSESGLLVASSGILGQVKLGQLLDVKLRVGGLDPKPLQVKVLRLTGTSILLSFDALKVAGRLQLEQEEREGLIRRSWRQFSPSTLHPSFHGSVWWHSVFDSNIWVWRDSANVLQKMIIEFESVAFVYDQQGTRFLKTPSAFDESKGYVGPLAEPLPHKVEPGHNWADRLMKIMLPGSALPEELIAEVRTLVPRSGSKMIHV